MPLSPPSTPSGSGQRPYRSPIPRIIALAARVVVALGAVGCHSIGPFLERARTTVPTSLVIVLPEGREHAEVVAKFVAAKRAAGLTVEVVTFDASAEAGPRRSRVARELDRLRPAAGDVAYVLFVATAQELPMGPWRVEGLEMPVESDLPLLLGDLDPETSIPEETWSRAMLPEFAWIPGRVPFDGGPELTSALSAAPAVMTGRSAPLAVLGAERFAVWWDTSLVMSRAKARFVEQGWKIVSFAEDAPRDVALGETDAEILRDQLRACGVIVVDGPQVPDPSVLFTAHWAQASPDVVYLNSHGSSLFLTSVGDYLLSEARLDRLAAFAAGAALRAAPATPAVVVIAACRAGGSDSALTARLFRDGWARVLVASTEDTSPTPLWSAIRAEIDTADALAAGLTAGLALRAVRESYFDDARSSWSYALFDSTAPDVARNLLALTLYGDPSAPVLARPPHDAAPQAVEVLQ